MTKVLFLDVDGVLGTSVPGTEGGIPLEPGRLRELRRVLDETGAFVVVTSSWREDPERVRLLAEKGVLERAHADWRVGDVVQLVRGRFILGRDRGDLVDDWLADHPEVTAYAIVDDEAVPPDDREGRFVRTEFADGLTAAVADRLIAVLGTRHTQARLRAMERGVALARSDAELAGGLLTEDEALARWGMGGELFRTFAAEGRFLALPHVDGSLLYPAMQFGSLGFASNLPKVVAALPSANPHFVLNFLVQPDRLLDGRTPASLLAEGQVDPVVQSASRVGQMGN